MLILKKSCEKSPREVKITFLKSFLFQFETSDVNESNSSKGRKCKIFRGLAKFSLIAIENVSFRENKDQVSNQKTKFECGS